MYHLDNIDKMNKQYLIRIHIWPEFQTKQQSSKYFGIYQALREIVSEEGIFALWYKFSILLIYDDN